MAKDDLHSSIQKVIQDDKPTIRKSIVIGVGGSGMKGVLAAKKWIEKNMPAEAHRYLRWVGIDTTDIETSVEGKGGLYRFPADQMFQEERRMLYIGAPTPAELSLDFLRDRHKNDPCYDWLPNPDVFDISTRAGQGANQTRPLGRLAFYFNEEAIRTALVRERDRLGELPDDPKYFQLLDVREGEGKKDEVLTFTFKRGVNRYYLNESLPEGNSIIAMEPDAAAKALLFPSAPGKITIESFPADEKGPYFEVSGARVEGKSISFKVRHGKRRGQISVFITCSIVGGTGNGMILDLAAQVRDIFKDYWPAPRIYGILVLPSAFKRVVYNKNARANAYAALKEIDYYMSGNTFRAKYPSGREVAVNDHVFDDGMLYLLDIENMAGNALQGRDQVQELTGQFISTFVASTVGGAIEERMVNDSTRASVYLPRSELSKRKACYNSFGISRVIYPVPILTDLGYKITAVKMAESFMKPVNGRLLVETLGDINRGLVRALRLNCRLVFERMYPDWKMDNEAEFKSYEQRLAQAVQGGDKRKVVALLETMLRDYGKEEIEKIKNNLLARMEKRYRVELEKMKTVLTDEIRKYIKDPNRGFLFTEAVINCLLDKLELYKNKYYRERVALARYSQEEMEKAVARIDTEGLKDKLVPQAVLEMARFNFSQLVFESMLASAENFARDFKSVLFNLKNMEVVVLKDKVNTLVEELKADVESGRFELLEKKNPLYFYLVNAAEIDLFLKNYFYSKLSIEDLCNDVDFVTMDREDDVQQFIETYLISTEGLSILDKKSDEVKDIISSRFGGLLGKSIEEVREALYGGGQSVEDGLNLSESTIIKIDVAKLKKKLFKVIHSRFEGFNFETISIRQILGEKKIPMRKILERLDTFSRPYIYVDASGLNAMEYYRVIANFRLDTYEEGDAPAAMAPNDLPARLDHYRKREAAVPPVSVETFEVPNLCKPYEMISIGILLGYPIFKLTSLEECARDYHEIIGEKTHPLHCFNAPSYDAKYFPDPFRANNYLNPARLWNGLVQMKILQQKEEGYVFDDSLAEEMKDIEARENYKQTVLNAEKKLLAAGDLEKAPVDALVEAVMGLAMLVKNPSSGKLQFARTYSLVVRDILDGDGTADRAKAQNMDKDEFIEKFVKAPEFADPGELVAFLESEYAVRKFIIESVKNIIQRTKGTVSAGADVTIPKWKREQVKLPVFADNFAFYDYCEKRGSLEWQNLLKNRMSQRLNQIVTSARFRLESDPSLIDRTKASAFLDSIAPQLPEIVVWEVKAENKIIK